MKLYIMSREKVEEKHELVNRMLVMMVAFLGEHYPVNKENRFIIKAHLNKKNGYLKRETQ
jgi:hypothetical protein